MRDTMVARRSLRDAVTMIPNEPSQHERAEEGKEVARKNGRRAPFEELEVLERGVRAPVQLVLHRCEAEGRDQGLHRGMGAADVLPKGLGGARGVRGREPLKRRRADCEQ